MSAKNWRMPGVVGWKPQWFDMPETPFIEPGKPFVYPNRTLDGPGYLYVAASLNLTKIGIASNVKARLRTLNAGSAAEVALLFARVFASYAEAAAAERLLHERFAPHRHHGEWFLLQDDDLASLRSELEAADAQA